MPYELSNHFPTATAPEDQMLLQNPTISLRGCPHWLEYGKVVQLVGNMVEAEGLHAALGDICQILIPGRRSAIFAEVVGFDHRRLKLSPLTALDGIQPGGLVMHHPHAHVIGASDALLGRVLDGLGQPIDDRGPLPPGKPYRLLGKATNPLTRPLIGEQLDVGVRCINGLLPIGKGQRMGIFAGSGVGKSTLLGMMARHTTAPVNVIALIGERGREVNEFLERELGEQGLAHSVVVVATSNQPATLRLRGAFVACAIAEYFRDQGQDVLFMMDSITRFAMAAREIGLAAGEPPTTKGYTPSVFSHMPQLLERAGTFQRGSITGIYTVLVEGDDLDDPIADTARSILDGHIVLDRQLANRRHYPSIDVLKSVSRLTEQLLDTEQKLAVSRFVQVLSRYVSSEDMINIGAYVRGTNTETDYAIAMIDRLNQYLQQPVEEYCPIEEAHRALLELVPNP
jgi:flagellum-specific ATP synthase